MFKEVKLPRGKLWQLLDGRGALCVVSVAPDGITKGQHADECRRGAWR